MVPQVGNKKG